MRKTKISRRNFLGSSLMFAALAPAMSSANDLFASSKTENLYKKTKVPPSYLALFRSGELGRRADALKAVYEECRLCPRDCRVDRTQGQLGKCRSSARVKVSSAYPHFGEEKPLVGQNGSGTIFFSNCGLRCLYCQNYSVSLEGEGIEISDERLAQSMLTLQKMGCHNINLVTPTQYLPNIVSALTIAIPKGLQIPLVYNTGGYERVDIVRLLEGIVDIYLPDCKYMDPENAAKYSEEAFNYPYYAKQALLEMQRQVGVLSSTRGIAVKGLMIRHLILPNRLAGTEEFLKFIAECFPGDTYVNLMGQYRPEYKAGEHPEIARRLQRKEYAEALDWARKYGVKRLAR